MSRLAAHSSNMRPVYLITFCCYGSILPGQAGSVDDDTNLYGSRHRPASDPLLRASVTRMKDHPAHLSRSSRQLVLRSILEVCAVRNWKLLAAHVRTSHVHAVLEADATPERVLLDFKVIASRALNNLQGKRTWWERHGSTRYLWTKSEIDRAVAYVVSEQGVPMSLFEASPRGAERVDA